MDGAVYEQAQRHRRAGSVLDLSHDIVCFARSGRCQSSAETCWQESLFLYSATRNRKVAMTKELEELVEKAKKINMTPEQATEQRQSFVYGNTHIENERITREMVAEADAKVSKEEAHSSNQTRR